MMTLPIRIYGDPLLRKIMPLVEDVNSVLPHIPAMIATMYDDDGIGLSANQAGISLRFFVIGEAAFTDGRPDSVFINPEILETSEELWDYEEGCLSVPGIREVVTRPKTVRVKYLNEKGENREALFTDLAARVFQHELDHLNGVFFVDRISPLRRSRLKKQLKRLEESQS
jgi:peptide deformylase